MTMPPNYMHGLGLRTQKLGIKVERPTATLPQTTSAPIFTISTGQFDVEWDAYMRHSEDRELVETEIKEIRDALIETSHKSSYGNRDDLKPEFKQWPTPADLCKSQLKQVSEMGAKFASVGGENGLVTYENIKAMQEALKD